MKIKFSSRLLIAIGTVGASLMVHAQSSVSYVDCATVASSSDISYTPRFYLDAGFSQLAPLNTVVWFVGSDDAQVATNSFGGFGPGGVLGADDTLILQVTGDGDAGGTLGAGYLGLAPFPVDSSVTNQHIFVYVWNQTTTQPSTITPVPGDKFGVLDLGIRPEPNFGNIDWNITQNINGTEFTVAVPEPSVMALVGIGGLGLLLRRRSRK